MKRALIFAAALFFSISIGRLVTAQNAAETTCAALVQAAFESFTESCTGKTSSTACYGYGTVSATFSEAISPAPLFAMARDTVDLTYMQTIRTGALDSESQNWGLAALNVQANEPLALTTDEPGLSVLMFGDVTLENRVLPEAAFIPVAGVPAEALLTANIRSSPNAEATILLSIPAGAQMIGDALSVDGQWLRVTAAENLVGWISTQLVSFDASALPVWTTQSRTPMQAFTLKTAAENTICASGAAETVAPMPMVVVQGPNTMTTLIEVNSAEISISSTIALRILPGNIMQMITLSGSARVGGVVVPAGFTVTAQLSEDGTTVEELWSFLRPINAEERIGLAALENLNPEIYHYYALQIPSEAEVQALVEAVQASNAQATPLAQSPGAEGSGIVNVSGGSSANGVQNSGNTNGVSNSGGNDISGSGPTPTPAPTWLPRIITLAPVNPLPILPILPVFIPPPTRRP